MLIGSLFSGYGGLDMAVQSVLGGELAWYSEIEPAACTVLAAHHPGVPNLGDITAVDWADVPPVDILTGGYPCQPFSHAGKRKGTNDERHLWPYVRDAIRVLRPRITVLENVRGHLTLGFDTVLADLAELGMSARWGVVRAADAGAAHGRARLFIVVTADAASRGWNQDVEQPRDLSTPTHEGQPGVADGHRADGPAADADGGRFEQRGPFPVALPVGQAGHSAARGGAPVGNTTVAGLEGRGIPQGGGSGYPVPVTAQGPSAAPAADSPSAERRGAEHANLGAASGSAAEPRERGSTDWGRYAPAIHRWESVLNRPAPTPTIPGTNGRPRLSPVFVEWMMGLPAGHVTGHGLRPAQELKMLGNGVVPQQAALALRMLLGEQVAT